MSIYKIGGFVYNYFINWENWMSSRAVSSFDRQSTAILEIQFDYLDLKSLANMMQMNRTCRAVASTDRLWRKLSDIRQDQQGDRDQVFERLSSNHAHWVNGNNWVAGNWRIATRNVVLAQKIDIMAWWEHLHRLTEANDPNLPLLVATRPCDTGTIRSVALKIGLTSEDGRRLGFLDCWLTWGGYKSMEMNWGNVAPMQLELLKQLPRNRALKVWDDAEHQKALFEGSLLPADKVRPIDFTALGIDNSRGSHLPKAPVPETPTGCSCVIL
jgi:hypothetical protein